MANLLSYYSVYTFQININTGDGAIHLLCHVTGDPATVQRRRQVLTAVMIDGGTVATNFRTTRPDAHQNVYETIIYIEDNFECTPHPLGGGTGGLRGRLLFDAFVVTHWDGDHAGGLMHFLLEDINTHPRQNPRVLTRAKYDAGGNPRSYLYAPSWRRCQEPNWRQRVANYFPDEPWRRRNHWSRFFSPKSSDYRGSKLPTAARLRAVIGRRGLTPPLLKMSVGKHNLLGRNFFSLQQHQGANLAMQANVDALLATNPPENHVVGVTGQAPGLYCLAANGYVINSTRMSNVTIRNQSSIATAVIWSAPPPGEPNADLHRVSHYMAGDAHIALERDICTWLNFTAIDTRNVSVVKLSHHGAITSTPPELLNTLKPQVILVSAGTHGSYGHPRWELLLKLYEYLAYPPLNATRSEPKPLMLTRYPYYINPARPSHPVGKISAKGVFEAMGKIKKSAADFFRSRNPAGGLNRGNMFADIFITKFNNRREEKPMLQAALTAIRNDVLPALLNNDLSLRMFGRRTVVANLVEVIGIPNQANAIGEYSRSSVLYEQFVMPTGQHRLDKIQWLTSAKTSSAGGRGGRTNGGGGGGDRHNFPARSLSVSSVDSWDLMTDDGYNDGGSREQDHKDDTGTADDKAFTIFPEGAVLPQDDDNAKFAIVPTDHCLHAFLSQLPTRCLLLDREPSSSGKDSVPAFNQDKLLQWLRMTLLSPSATMSLTTRTWPPQAREKEPPTLECRADLSNGHTLVLDSEKAYEVLGVTEDLVTRLMAEKGQMVFAARIVPTSIPVPPEKTLAYLNDKNSQQSLTTVKKNDDENVDAWTVTEIASFFELTGSLLVKVLGTVKFTPTTTTKIGDNQVKARNVFWFTPELALRTNLRLQFHLSDGLDTFRKWLNPIIDGKPLIPTFTVNSVTLVARKSWTAAYANDKNDAVPIPKSSSDFEFCLSVTFVGEPFDAYVTVSSESRITIRLQHDKPGESLLQRIWDWIYKDSGAGMDDGTFEGDKLTKQGKSNGFLGAIKPRVFELSFTCSEAGIPQRLEEIRMDLQVDVAIGKKKEDNDDKNKKLVFFVSFGWSRTTRVFLKGSLWCPLPEEEYDFTKALSGYEKHLAIEPAIDKDQTLLPSVDLAALAGLTTPLPRGLPTTVSQAEMEINSHGVSFTGALVSKPPDGGKPPGKMPGFDLERVFLTAAIGWGGGGDEGGDGGDEGGDESGGEGEGDVSIQVAWMVQLEVNVLLYPNNDPGSITTPMDNDPNSPPLEPAALTGTIDLNNDHWEITAIVENLTGAHLASFFDDDSRPGAMALLQHMGIKIMELKYTYSPGAEAGASQFEFNGDMYFGCLLLGVKFLYSGSGRWDFSAGLNVKKPEDQDEDEAKAGVSLLDLLEGILGEKIPELPKAVGDIPISRPSKTGEDDDSLLNFSCSKTPGPNDKDGKETAMIVLVASIHLPSVSLTFTQWRDTNWDDDVPSKRIIKVGVSEIGPITAPIVGKVDELPLEELAYVWVSDKATQALKDKKKLEAEAKAGVTRAEFDSLGPKLYKKDRLFYKSPKAEPGEVKNGDVVLQAGSHFMVIAKNTKGESTAMIDHIFGRPKPVAKPKSEVELNRERLRQKRKLAYRWNNIIDEYDEIDEMILAPTDTQDLNKDLSKGPFKVTIGPLTIENIGLEFDLVNQRLGIVFDATFLMGPIGLALIGFGLSARLGKPRNDKDKDKDIEGTSQNLIRLLDDDKKEEEEAGSGIPISELEVNLKGLLVSFDRPPVTVAGGFMKSDISGLKCYAGGLVISFKPWMISAVGMYASIPKDPSKMPKFMARNLRRRQLEMGIASLPRGRVFELDEADEMIVAQEEELWRLDQEEDKDEKFTMVFVIVRVEGPLFSVGFVDISGLTGGVGINTEMRLPTAETVLSFPFLGSSTVGAPNDSPLKSLMALLAPPAGQTWFSPREDSFWFAAGLKATAFQILSVEAVVVLQLNPDVQLGLYGVAVCDLPSLMSSAKFVHVELGIACTLDVAAGTFKLEAQLSPRSFILDSNCHLTGGMALYAWFEPKVPSPDKDLESLRGDWVLTIGGYHQAYNRPRAYPNPPRLGINWTLSSALRISGEAYFAITPRICMAGGRLHATLNLGALSAWFDAFLDLLLNFQPFYFYAVGGVSVGVKFSMDLWLVTIRISVEIAATLTVAGPPMAGMVHVDFWVFGFDINFGGGMTPRPIPQTLPEFIKLVLKSGSQGSGSASPMAGFLTGRDDDTDWVALGEKGEDAFFSKDAIANDDKSKTTKPFLFNCTSGLVPKNKIAGQREPVPSLSSSSRVSSRTAADDEKVWIVQPGPFLFSITTAVPSNAGSIKDERINAISPQPMPDGTFRPEHSSIYALPMCLEHTGMKVTVEITIKQNKKAAVQLRRMKPGLFETMEDKREPGVWGVEPIVKAVPASLWGKYSQDTDPSLRGNNVSALLAGTSDTNKGTVNLVMGFEITPPKPMLYEDAIKKISVLEDTKENVLPDGAPDLPVRQLANKAWNPRDGNGCEPEKPTPPSEDEDEEEEKKRWDRMKEAWETPKNDPADVVKVWASRLNFAEGSLTGKRPQRLLDRFQQMIPALPQVAVGF